MRTKYQRLVPGSQRSELLLSPSRTLAARAWLATVSSAALAAGSRRGRASPPADIAAFGYLINTVIVVDFFIAAGLIAGLCGALITFPVAGGLFEQQRRMLQGMTTERRRAFYRRIVLIYGVVGGYCALLFVHPFGLRNTFIYCLIIPFLVIAPLGTFAVGLWSRKRPAQTRHPDHD